MYPRLGCVLMVVWWLLMVMLLFVPACGGPAPKQDRAKITPAAYCGGVRQESACYGAGHFDAQGRWVDEGWGDSYHKDEWGRIVLTYRGWVVWTCPYPRRVRKT